MFHIPSFFWEPATAWKSGKPKCLREGGAACGCFDLMRDDRNLPLARVPVEQRLSFRNCAGEDAAWQIPKSMDRSKLLQCARTLPGLRSAMIW